MTKYWCEAEINLLVRFIDPSEVVRSVIAGHLYARMEGSNMFRVATSSSALQGYLAERSVIQRTRATFGNGKRAVCDKRRMPTGVRSLLFGNTTLMRDGF
jgi:hypothetical protein